MSHLIRIFAAAALLLLLPLPLFAHHKNFYGGVFQAIKKANIEEIKDLFSKSAWEGKDRAMSAAELQQRLKRGRAKHLIEQSSWDDARSRCFVQFDLEYADAPDRREQIWLLAEDVDSRDRSWDWRIVRIVDDSAQALAFLHERIISDFRSRWDAQPGYMRKTDDQGWKARMRTLCLLAKRSDALPALVQALQDKDAEVRAFAAQALGFVGDTSIGARMDEVLAKDPDPITRLYAADALGMIGGMQPKELYEKVANEDANRDVHAHVRFALERKGERLSPGVRMLFEEFEYSKMDTAKLGEPAPDFALVDALGRTCRLSDYRDKRAVVLIFIYGDT